MHDSSNARAEASPIVTLAPRRPEPHATSPTAVTGANIIGRLPLSALLLFVLSYANLWILHHVPGLDWLEQTLPRVIWFTLLMGYIAIAWLPGPHHPRRRARLRRLRSLIAFGVIAVNVVLPTLLFIQDRLVSGANAQNIIDWPLQIEAGSRLVLHGQSPYGVDYSFSEMQAWSEDANFPENPALRHAIHLPVNFLLSAIALPVWEALVGWYDARVLLIAAYLVVVLIGPYLASGWEEGHALQISLALNPILVESFVMGLSDYLLLAMIVTFLALRMRKQHRAAAAVLGLAIATRQFSWFLVPVYLASEWFILANHHWQERLGLLARRLWPLPLVALGITAPFFLANPRGFYEDVIAFGSGNIADAYPIGGPHTYGLSVLVLGAGLVDRQVSYFPFGPIQLLTTVPLLVAAIWLQKRDNTTRRMLLSYFLMLSIFLFTGRFMHTNYVGYLFALLLLTYFVREAPSTFDSIPAQQR